MNDQTGAVWTDEMSVFFTSFWGWSPETWGTVGWTGDGGLSHRAKLLKTLSDPFIAVIYVTKSAGAGDQNGKIVGFYLVSHEQGHRNDFTHPSHHDLEPHKWVHSLRATRAFSYIPEHCQAASDFDSSLPGRALAVAKWGEVVTDRGQINRLRNIPWVEVPVYVPTAHAVEMVEELAPEPGFTRAGPANRNSYTVSSNAQALPRHLYILCLDGSTDAYLGKAASGGRIYKIGLSASPELRRQSLQSALPDGAFQWTVYRSSESAGHAKGFSFSAAVDGEYAMKKHLAKCAKWLGGEFYLASEGDVDAAWKLGCRVARDFRKS